MTDQRPGRAVGYVLKGYPRRSELFIASEIWRLEQLGVPLRLFVLKAPTRASTTTWSTGSASSPTTYLT